MSVAISVDNVTKKYGEITVVDGLSAEIHPGEFFTLLGPSGCGKTTLLRMIIGFNSIEGGEIRVDGRRVNDIPVNQRNMGMVFQNYAVFPHMSVFDNVAFGLKMHRMDKEHIAGQVADILETVKIGDLGDRMPDKLSGGQQQRVALARAIVFQPEVLLMDEPLSNLDAKLRIEMRSAIKQIQRQTKITTVYVTHDQDEALAVSDRIAVMNSGIIQQIDTPQRLYQRPANLFVATFIGRSNVLEGTVLRQGDRMTLSIPAEEGGDRYQVEMPTLRQDIPDGTAVKVSVRPEEFIIGHSGGQEGVAATVESCVFQGSTVHYFLRCQGVEMVVVESSDQAELLPENTVVRLLVKPHKINVFDQEGVHSLIAKEEQP